MLDRDRKLVEVMRRVAESFDREGRGHATPAILRKAADRLEVLSERKRLLASYRTTPTPDEDQP